MLTHCHTPNKRPIAGKCLKCPFSDPACHHSAQPFCFPLHSFLLLTKIYSVIVLRSKLSDGRLMPTQRFRLRGLQIFVFATRATNVMSVVCRALQHGSNNNNNDTLQSGRQFACQRLYVTLFNFFVFASSGARGIFNENETVI